MGAECLVGGGGGKLRSQGKSVFLVHKNLEPKLTKFSESLAIEHL